MFLRREDFVTPCPERCTVHVTVGAYTSTKYHYNSFGSCY